MKKVLSITAIALFALSFAACKKDYTCCYYDETGTKVEIMGFGCIKQKMSKKDMKEVEDAGNTGAALLGWTFKCES